MGKHDFVFEIDDKFFEQYEYSEVDKGKLKLELELTKQETLMVLSFVITGHVKLACDRCLEIFEMPLNIEDKVYIKYGESIPDTGYIGEENEIFTHDQPEINIAQFIYEFINLNIPYKRVHPDKENGEAGCELDFTEDVDIQEPEMIVDPRWSKLKDIL